MAQLQALRHPPRGSRECQQVLVKTVISQMCHCAVKAVANNSRWVLVGVRGCLG